MAFATFTPSQSSESISCRKSQQDVEVAKTILVASKNVSIGSLGANNLSHINSLTFPGIGTEEFVLMFNARAAHVTLIVPLKYLLPELLEPLTPQIDHSLFPCLNL
ncbi:hypothetical protein J6590_046654 [Homalodisca vitripennis]|nr:hypothetical protein J6590_046654 [Homalodisca vitripennis]